MCSAIVWKIRNSENVGRTFSNLLMNTYEILVCTAKNCSSLRTGNICLHDYKVHHSRHSFYNRNVTICTVGLQNIRRTVSKAHVAISNDIPLVFSSPELITCRPSSVRLSVCLSVCPSVCKLFTFSSSSPEPLGQFQPNLAQSILG